MAGETILVGDDEPKIVKTVRTHVANAEFRVVTADSGPLALTIARHEKPALVILDLGLPGEVEVIVADDGPGTPPEELPYVFDRFWRSDFPGLPATAGSRSHLARAEGSGLGLASAREPGRALGGRIWAESTPGHGTAFHLTLRSARP